MGERMGEWWTSDAVNRESGVDAADEHLPVGTDAPAAFGARAVVVQAELLPEWYRATRCWFYGALGLVAALTFLVR
jgi:hypothetical protein